MHLSIFCSFGGGGGGGGIVYGGDFDQVLSLQGGNTVFSL